MKKNLLFLLFLFSIIGSIYAGPFGLEKGMSFDEVKEACGGREPVSADNGAYIIIPTKPHPYFVRYIAWIDPKEGLHYIKAIGSDISTNGYGIEVRSKFDSLETTLSKTYGTCDRTNVLLPGSIWRDADDWMMAISKKERYMMSAWEKKYGSSLPDSITGVYMAVYASSSYSGYICLEYEFSNNAKVEAAKKADEDSVL